MGEDRTRVIEAHRFTDSVLVCVKTAREALTLEEATRLLDRLAEALSMEPAQLETAED